MLSNFLLRKWLRVFALIASLILGSNAQAQQVFINEAMSSNSGGYLDEDGDSSDWIELYNGSSQAIDLTGYGLTDSSKDLFKWVYPQTSINSSNYLIVFASGKNRQTLAATSVAPDLVSGLVVWLRADSINTSDPTQTQHSGEYTYVSQWLDQSGCGNSALQLTTYKQPQWVGHRINGYPALHFDGADDLLHLNDTPATNNFCLMLVARPEQTISTNEPSHTSLSGLQGQHYVLGAAHGGGTAAGAGLSLGLNGAGIYEHGDNYMPPLDVFYEPVGNKFTIVSVNYQARTPSLFLQSYPHRKGLESTRPTVLAPFEIGMGSYGAFKGDIAEILVYNRALSEEERLSVERYLARKYDLPIVLPRHTNFKLSKEGETLRLTKPDGATVDTFATQPMPLNVSYGREPNGAPVLSFFTNATPNASNTTGGTAEWVTAPVLSVAGGFYASEFPLAISTPTLSATIHYTLDGSEPTEASPVYSSPIRISDRAGTPNDISTIPTTRDNQGWRVPNGEVFKGWVVRAKAFKSDALDSSVTTDSYWITPKGRARYSIPVVSLVTDRANLFDPQIGIYIPGLDSNYNHSGPEWERPGHLEVYETNNSLAISQDAGVSIHGNTSQLQPIKGLDLNSNYGQGRNPFHYQVFPENSRAEFSRFLLRPSGQDQTFAFMRDELTQSLAAETGAETQASRPCVVFINGEYWGLNYFKEKENNEYISYYSGLATDQLDFLINYAAPLLGDAGIYWSLVDFLSHGDLEAEDAYSKLEYYMQTANYIDSKILEIYAYRWDIGGAQLMWRPRNEDGRLRWIHFDYDVAFGGFGALQPAWAFDMLDAETTTGDTLYGHNDETRILVLRQSLKIPQFKREFINRFADLLNTLLTPAHIIERIDSLAGQLEPEMPEHILRWGNPDSFSTWQTNVQYLRDFALARPAYARQHLIDHFGLSGTYALSVSVSDTNQGTIQLNSLALSAPSQTPWSGEYFTGNPISLTAAPQAGFVFSQWNGLPANFTGDAAQTNITLSPSNDVVLEAVFRPVLQPRITNCQWLGEGVIELGMQAELGTRCTLQTSTNLVAWENIQTLGFNSTEPVGIVYLEDQKTSCRFFRLLITE